jgi:hypothetical protein
VQKERHLDLENNGETDGQAQRRTDRQTVLSINTIGKVCGVLCTNDGVCVVWKCRNGSAETVGGRKEREHKKDDQSMGHQVRDLRGHIGPLDSDPTKFKRQVGRIVMDKKRRRQR